MTKRSLKEIVRGSVKLSSLPKIYFRIQAVLNDPRSSFADIAEVISSDVALSARIMRIVNSSFYQFPSQIDSITHAVSIIGTWQLRDLALSTTILSTFKGVPEKHINMNSFWKHSITCGITARLIGIQKPSMSLRHQSTWRVFTMTPASIVKLLHHRRSTRWTNVGRMSKW